MNCLSYSPPLFFPVHLLGFPPELCAAGRSLAVWEEAQQKPRSHSKNYQVLVHHLDKKGPADSCYLEDPAYVSSYTSE